jgi:hypothetical protein
MHEEQQRESLTSMHEEQQRENPPTCDLLPPATKAPAPTQSDVIEQTLQPLILMFKWCLISK